MCFLKSPPHPTGKMCLAFRALLHPMAYLALTHSSLYLAFLLIPRPACAYCLAYSSSTPSSARPTWNTCAPQACSPSCISSFGMASPSTQLLSHDIGSCLCLPLPHALICHQVLSVPPLKWSTFLSGHTLEWCGPGSGMSNVQAGLTGVSGPTSEAEPHYHQISLG